MVINILQRTGKPLANTTTTTTTNNNNSNNDNKEEEKEKLFKTSKIPRLRNHVLWVLAIMPVMDRWI